MPRTHISLMGRIITAILLLLVLAPAGLGSAGAFTPARAAAPEAAIAAASEDRIQGADVTATITVSPTTVEAGQTVAITGTGFKAGEPVDLQLVTTGGVTSTVHLAYARADSAGAFNAPKVRVRGDAPAGAYRVLAVGLSSATAAHADLTVTAPKPELAVSPATFGPGDAIRVAGKKFGPNEKITLSLGTTSGSASVPIGEAQTSASGSFGPITINVPFGVPAGKLDVQAVGQSSNRQATAAVTVNAPTPTLTVNPTSGKPGEKITVTGTHFQPGETVTVDLVALATSARLGTAQVNASGGFTITGAAIPNNTPQGTVSVVATGTKSHISATVQIKVGSLPASLTFSSDSVKAGDTVSLSGKGFIPGETVTIQLTGGKLPPLTLAAAVAGTDGTFTIAKLVIPTFVPAGSYTAVVSGQTSGRTVKTGLTVKAPPPAAPLLSIIDTAHVTGTPFQLTPGGLVQIAGSGFPAGAKVTIALVGNSGTITLALLTANGAGALTPVGITLPANTPSGTYTLQALVGGKKVASQDVKVAPLTPHLTISVGTLTPGATVTVHGTGYAPGEQIVLSLNGSALATKPTTVLADVHGSFTLVFIVPATVTGGTNILLASGTASRASSSVNVTANLPVATRWYFVNGDTTGGNRTQISMLNPTDAPATVKMTFLYQAGPERQYSQVVPAHSEAAVGLGLAAGYGRHVSTILEADRQISAQSTVYYAGGDSTSALGASGPSKTWYLAEGYTNGSFREFLSVMNPNTTFATIDVRFLPFNNRPAREVRFVMQPRSNITIDAGQYMPGQSISAVVTADKDVVVERSMRFGANGRGAHDKIGTTSASTVWIFAQGVSSGDRQTFFTILNPNQAAPAAVTATFFDRTGKPVGARTIIVDPLHRGNIKLNDVLPNADVATILTSNVPVVVERPLYEGPANLGIARSGSVIFGRNGGGLSWAFPTGNTANGYKTQMYLFNPGLKPVSIKASFYTTTGAVFTHDLTLAPNSDNVVDASSVPGMPATEFGAVLKSTNGQVFIAEESIINAGTQQASSTQGVAQ